MSDDTNETPEVHAAPVVKQKRASGLLPGGNNRLTNPTPAEVRTSSRRRFYAVLPEIARIARNTPKPPRKKPGEAVDPTAKKKRPYKTSDQLRAAEILGRYGNDDRISAADLREACRGMAQDIRDFLPADQADALLSIVARRFVYL